MYIQYYEKGGTGKILQTKGGGKRKRLRTTDIGYALDQGKYCTLSDLSSAFDTVDHLILLDCLQTRFGITGNVLSLLRSFLFQRDSVVSLDGSLSDSCVEKWSVPQGSVLGPCYLIYTIHLLKILFVIMISLSYCMQMIRSYIRNH